MRASIAFLVPLIASAIAYPYHAKRENGTALATSYTINGFQTFTTSSAGNNSVSFSMGDNLGNEAECSFLSDSTAAKAADATQFHACENPNVSFVWDGTSLTIVEFYAVSGAEFQAATSVTQPSTFCFSISPPFPLGAGTLCETPTGQIGGEFKALST